MNGVYASIPLKFIDRFWPSNFQRSILAIESSFSLIDFAHRRLLWTDFAHQCDRTIDQFHYSRYARARGKPVSPAGSMPSGTGAGNRTLWHSGNLCLVNWSPLQQIRREKHQLLLPLEKRLKQRVGLTWVML